MRPLRAVAAALLLAAACAPPGAGVDAGRDGDDDAGATAPRFDGGGNVDAGITPDAGRLHDGGTVEDDAGPRDAGAGDAGAADAGHSDDGGLGAGGLDDGGVDAGADPVVDGGAVDAGADGADAGSVDAGPIARPDAGRREDVCPDAGCLPPADVVASGVFGGSRGDYAHVVRAFDDRVLVAGSRRVYDAGPGGGFVAGLHLDGGVVWQLLVDGDPQSAVLALVPFGDGVAFAGRVHEDGAVFAAGTPTEITCAPRAEGSAFVATAALDGALRTAACFASGGPPYAETAADLAVLDDGALIAVGVLGGPDWGRADVDDAGDPPAGVGSAFVARFTADGALEWSLRAGPGTTGANAVAAAEDGGFVVLGHAEGDAVVVGRDGVDVPLPAADARLFLARYTAAGALVAAAPIADTVLFSRMARLVDGRLAVLLPADATIALPDGGVAAASDDEALVAIVAADFVPQGVVGIPATTTVSTDAVAARAGGGYVVVGAFGGVLFPGTAAARAAPGGFAPYLASFDEGGAPTSVVVVGGADFSNRVTVDEQDRVGWGVWATGDAPSIDEEPPLPSFGDVDGLWVLLDMP